ncbi:MAG: DJ-1/PfpI family protein, partial [Acutalibacteraceae bacterium]|nr:DJ-1/PfpI family protein [Acutalibacteraceae bacterium]
MLYMFFADGFEEVEAVATLDVIRRAGIEIQSVGIGSEIIQGSHNMKFICDKTDSDISVSDNLKGIILPGGMPGTTNLMVNSVVNEFI